MNLNRFLTFGLLLFIGVAVGFASAGADYRLLPAGQGYCRTSVNAAVFRGSSVVSNDSLQYISYYDSEGYVVLGKRRLDSDIWTLNRTDLKGKVADGHNVISIGLDGDGCLHLAFDHHGDPLRYCRMEAPGSLVPGPLTRMVGTDEGDVTYPEFHTMPNGDLLFAYRSGVSGNGNLVLNRYDLSSGTWKRVHDSIIDGEGKRNAYWQMYVDRDGEIYLSWVWRESWLVETNHDLCYAKSSDGGVTWQKSDGTPYQLPITLDSAEIAWNIPQNSELINQTGMSADNSGHPYIATYWREQNDSIPQYRLVWHDGKRWRMSTVGERNTPFSLSGGGTKMIPVSRPKIVSDGKSAFYIFRDAERGSVASMAYTSDLDSGVWMITDLTDFAVNAWEPSYDQNLWNRSHRLNIFLQNVYQGDGEKVVDDVAPSTPVFLLVPTD